MRSAAKPVGSAALAIILIFTAMPITDPCSEYNYHAYEIHVLFTRIYASA